MCVANGLHVPPIAYKLRSLSDLPGLILQVARTPTHAVLVSVSVSAVVYTRILVLDRIGVCPHRPFSSDQATGEACVVQQGSIKNPFWFLKFVSISF